MAASSLAKLIVAIIIGLTFGHGGQSSGAVSPQQRPSADAAASRRTFETRPTGEWVATGHVLTAKRVADRSVGEVLHRRWRFQTRCTDGACQTYLLRTSSTGVQSSPLRFLPNNYLAEFGNLGTACEARPGYFKTFSVTFSIWWTKHRSQLVAEEMGGVRRRPAMPLRRGEDQVDCPSSLRQSHGARSLIAKEREKLD